MSCNVLNIYTEAIFGSPVECFSTLYCTVLVTLYIGVWTDSSEMTVLCWCVYFLPLIYTNI